MNLLIHFLLIQPISHSQFKTIHAYRDENGRLGRALIPIQLAKLTNDRPILFLSEVIELYKPSYHKFLNESRKGNMSGFIKFFLQCIIEQCNNYISKINMIKSIYNRDMDKIKTLNSNAVYRIMSAIMHQIVFTKKRNIRRIWCIKKYCVYFNRSINRIRNTCS